MLWTGLSPYPEGFCVFLWFQEDAVNWTQPIYWGLLCISVVSGGCCGLDSAHILRVLCISVVSGGCYGLDSAHILRVIVYFCGFRRMLWTGLSLYTEVYCVFLWFQEGVVDWTQPIYWGLLCISVVSGGCCGLDSAYILRVIVYFCGFRRMLWTGLSLYTEVYCVFLWFQEGVVDWTQPIYWGLLCISVVSGGCCGLDSAYILRVIVYFCGFRRMLWIGLSLYTEGYCVFLWFQEDVVDWTQPIYWGLLCISVVSGGCCGLDSAHLLRFIVYFCGFRRMLWTGLSLYTEGYCVFLWFQEDVVDWTQPIYWGLLCISVVSGGCCGLDSAYILRVIVYFCGFRRMLWTGLSLYTEGYCVFLWFQEDVVDWTQPIYWGLLCISVVSGGCCGLDSAHLLRVIVYFCGFRRMLWTGLSLYTEGYCVFLWFQEDVVDWTQPIYWGLLCISVVSGGCCGLDSAYILRVIVYFCGFRRMLWTGLSLYTEGYCVFLWFQEDVVDWTQPIYWGLLCISVVSGGCCGLDSAHILRFIVYFCGFRRMLWTGLSPYTEVYCVFLWFQEDVVDWTQPIYWGLLCISVVSGGCCGLDSAYILRVIVYFCGFRRMLWTGLSLYTEGYCVFLWFQEDVVDWTQPIYWGLLCISVVSGGCCGLDSAHILRFIVYFCGFRRMLWTGLSLYTEGYCVFLWFQEDVVDWTQPIYWGLLCISVVSGGCCGLDSAYILRVIVYFCGFRRMLWTGLSLYTEVYCVFLWFQEDVVDWTQPIYWGLLCISVVSGGCCGLDSAYILRVIVYFCGFRRMLWTGLSPYTEVYCVFLWFQEDVVDWTQPIYWGLLCISVVSGGCCGLDSAYILRVIVYFCGFRRMLWTGLSLYTEGYCVFLWFQEDVVDWTQPIYWGLLCISVVSGGCCGLDSAYILRVIVYFCGFRRMLWTGLSLYTEGYCVFLWFQEDVVDWTQPIYWGLLCISVVSGGCCGLDSAHILRFIVYFCGFRRMLWTGLSPYTEVYCVFLWFQEDVVDWTQPIYWGLLCISVVSGGCCGLDSAYILRFIVYFCGFRRMLWTGLSLYTEGYCVFLWFQEDIVDWTQPIYWGLLCISVVSGGCCGLDSAYILRVIVYFCGFRRMLWTGLSLYTEVYCVFLWFQEDVVDWTQPIYWGLLCISVVSGGCCGLDSAYILRVIVYFCGFRRMLWTGLSLYTEGYCVFLWFQEDVVDWTQPIYWGLLCISVVSGGCCGLDSAYILRVIVYFCGFRRMLWTGLSLYTEGYCVFLWFQEDVVDWTQPIYWGLLCISVVSGGCCGLDSAYILRFIVYFCGFRRMLWTGLSLYTEGYCVFLWFQEDVVDWTQPIYWGLLCISVVSGGCCGLDSAYILRDIVYFCGFRRMLWTGLSLYTEGYCVFLWFQEDVVDWTQPIYWGILCISVVSGGCCGLDSAYILAGGESRGQISQLGALSSGRAYPTLLLGLLWILRQHPLVGDPGILDSNHVLHRPPVLP